MILDLFSLFSLSFIYSTIKVLSTCEDKRNKNDEDRGGIEEAILWYNRVLGFRIECGHGMYFSNLWSILIILSGQYLSQVSLFLQE